MRTVFCAWILIPLVAACSVSGCAERGTPSESEIRAHPEGWAERSEDATSTGIEFHGDRVAEDGLGTCVGCHGERLTGEGGAGIGCYDCHNGPSGHAFGWLDSSSETEFHARAVQATGPSRCQTCHGPEYRGGSSGVSCFTCHAQGPSGHPDGWFRRDSRSFHGRAVEARGLDDCRQCHGTELYGGDGGTSGVACSDCHRD